MSNTITGREVLRLIADGVSMDEIEFTYPDYNGQWVAMSDSTWHVDFIANDRDGVQFRRKPLNRIVNGFAVPAPETKAPPHKCKYYLADVYDDSWFTEQSWDNTEPDNRWLERGLVFLDKDAAIANAKAMCGIDPSKGEEK